jgi:hypothetical protein
MLDRSATRRAVSRACDGDERYLGYIWNVTNPVELTTFETEQNEWQVPPDALSRGQRYVLEVLARSSEPGDLSLSQSIAVAEPFTP